MAFKGKGKREKRKVKSEKSYSMAFKGKGKNPIASLSEE